MLPSASFFVGTTPAREGLRDKTINAIDSCHVFMDDPPSGGSWSNVKRALMYAHDADWTVICDDDILPCANFSHEARRALSHCPGGIASLVWFYRKSPVIAAQKKGASWIETAYFVYGPCFAVKTHLAPLIIEWTAQNLRDGFTVGDRAVGTWAAANGVKCYGLVPSIVEHNQDMVSISQPGVVNTYATACALDMDPREREWNSEAVPYGGDAAGYVARSIRAGIIKS